MAQFQVRPLALIAFCLLVGGVLTGCGEGDLPAPPMAEVSGTVLLDDKPLPEGTIVFEEGSKGLTNSLEVKDGKFAGKVSVGEKKVMISAVKDGPPNEMYPDQPTKINAIPSKYNVESELKASIPSGGAKDLEFKVTST